VSGFVTRRPPKFGSIKEERLHRKQRLAAGFRVLGRAGFGEGVAGHASVRDPDPALPGHYWINSYGQSFRQIKVSDLCLVDGNGTVVEGPNLDESLVAFAALTIHGAVHEARPDVVSAVHTHGLHGRTLAALGTPLAPISQDACAFYEDLGLLDDYTGVVLDAEEGKRLAHALGGHKAVLLRNHGVVTVGHSVDEAMWWHLSFERCAQSQLMAEAAGQPHLIPHDAAAHTATQVGSHRFGWFSFQPLFDWIVAEEPDLLD
jgi:ribulose-5-phosphate 4-epimerase/fuculose-1-phosphate aldolase